MGAGGLANRQDNAIQLVVQFQVDARDDLRARTAARLADEPQGEAERADDLLPPVPAARPRRADVGYSTTARSQTGLEQSLNDYLTGSNTNLSNAF